MPTFEIGPDKPGDLRTARPYFLVPLLGLDAAKGVHHHRDRIIDYVKDQEFTDVFLLSHGWHRNFFSAVAAYDRLISRFAALSRRGRLQPKTQPFRPLFLAMHWNSDPQEDAWVDTAGRRDKSSFLARAAALFEPAAHISEGAFLNALEDLYEFMTYISAPDVKAFAPDADRLDTQVFTALTQNCEVRGRLDGGPPTPPEEKVALIWRCYDEAEPQRVLLDQAESPQAFANPFSALSNLLKFLVAAVGLFALLGLIPKLLGVFHISTPDLLQRAVGWLAGRPVVGPALEWVAPRGGSVHWGRLLTALTAAAAAILGGTIFWQQTLRHGRGARGLPVLAVGSWLPLQLLLTLPLLLYLFTTFLFRTPLVLLAPLAYGYGPAWHGSRLLSLVAFLLACVAVSFGAGALDLPVSGLSDERPPAGRRIRDGLAWVARLPIRAFRLSVAPDSRSLGLAEGLEKQLAFWEMQRKGVRAGCEAGRFVDGLLQTLQAARSPALADARIHLIGHSFGGLVLVNAARVLAAAPRPFDSLILLQAAIGSAWFAREPWCRNGEVLRGVLACVYSAYDMANGFYYPASNNGRMAAGYVGLCRVGSRRGRAQCLGKGGLFASLSQPPDLASHVHGAAPYALNLDASRLIYAGDAAAGGGHDDVYKDDVIHMLWAITQLCDRTYFPFASPGGATASAQQGRTAVDEDLHPGHVP